MKSFLIASSVLLVCISCGKQADAQSPTPSPNFECPNNDPEGGMFPNPTDCTKYYECSNGYAWEFECPPGLVFNPSMAGCDFPGEIDCRNPVVTTPAATTTTSTSAPTTPELLTSTR